MKLTDSHCHIDFSDFDADRDQVLNDATAAGVYRIIVPGVQQSTWINIQACCKQYPQLYPCYGLHPYFLDHHTEADLQQLDRQLSEQKAVAVGECGLDFFLKHLDKTKQQHYFEQQLDIALQHQLPVVIHARKSTEAVILAIKQRPGLRGMIHSYSGSYEQAVTLIQLGFYLSFGGPVTYTNSSRLRKLVQSLPLESLLLETDAPDQPTAHARCRRNEPANLTEVLHTFALLHDTEPEKIALATTENANNLFQLV